MLRAVVDTNQFISSVISKKGASARLIDAWRHFQFRLIISTDIFEEIKKVLRYPRVTKACKLTSAEVDIFIAFIRKRAVILTNVPKINVIKDDPDDNAVLACAIKAQADCIVSGDEHLLALKVYKGIKILNVQDFLKLL